jgi:predicted ArsR family transcriptional regulator
MATPEAPALSDLAALSTLDDPTRRKLYDFVASSAAAVGRDEAAAAVGITRSLAAYHLDKLAGHELLEVSYGRPDGRSGPGAGRPAKLYRRAEREFVLHAPSRDYGLLAEIVLSVAESSGSSDLRADLERAAREIGWELGRASRPSSPYEALRARGYEPFDADAGVVRFRNCPFHTAATAHRELVCRLNLALVGGILTGLGASTLGALLEPGEAACCVAVRPKHPNEQLISPG